MPLVKSRSKAAFSKNVAEMVNAGHPQKQALAAAYATQRKYADGGDAGFMDWYTNWAQKAGIDPNPDNPEHQYDYRAAYRAGVSPSIDPTDQRYHWPSQFKSNTHPNRFVKVGNRYIDSKREEDGEPIAMKGYAAGGLSRRVGGGPVEPFHAGGLLKSNTPGRTDRLPISVPAEAYIIPADVVSGLGQGNTMAGEKILDDVFLKDIPKRALGGSTNAVPIVAAGGEYNVPPEAVTRLGKGNITAGHKILDNFVVTMRKHIAETMKKLPPPK